MMLYIVATPIGNLKDITVRAIDVLKSVNMIAAEDTRHTKILLKHYEITTPLTSYHEHSSESKTQQIIALLESGKDVALVSDAGTPGISDPGYVLIKQAQEKSIVVTALPGPTAAIAALSLSGAPAHRFCFEGFLPLKPGARRKRLEALKDESRTIIFYEAPHRLQKILKEIAEILNDPVVACVREITKKYEEVKKARASELLEWVCLKKPRGEFVLVLEPNEKEKSF